MMPLYPIPSGSEMMTPNATACPAKRPCAPVSYSWVRTARSANRLAIFSVLAAHATPTTRIATAKTTRSVARRDSPRSETAVVVRSANTAAAIAKESLEKVAVAVVPFILVEIFALGLLVAFPALSLWMPGLLGFLR